ncbi:MAG: hypothetical protein V1777_04305 [Candidatus Micrarchaeota archaeon]
MDKTVQPVCRFFAKIILYIQKTLAVAMVSMDAILRSSEPSQEFKHLDERFQKNDIEHRVRYSVLIGHLYLENRINILLEKIAAKNSNHALGWATDLSFYNKSTLLLFNGLIKPNLHAELKKINDARNAFVHKLWPAEAKFDEISLLEESGIEKIRVAIIAANEELKNIRI